jgi:septum formation protein
MNLVFSTSNLPIVLASSSAVRKKILAESFIPFIVDIPEFDEEQAKQKLVQKFTNNTKINIKKIALELAIGKAKSLSKKYPNQLIIGSDQICEFKGNIINKSNSAKEAINQLQMMSNDLHLQHNAVVITLNNKVIFKNSNISKMWLRHLSFEQIKSYVDIDKPWGCAGSYKYESLGKHLFKKVEGDYYSILGLAIQPVIAFLYQQKLLNFNSNISYA